MARRWNNDFLESSSKKCINIYRNGDFENGLLLYEDRKYIGVYPLKGKILNVRGEPQKRIGDNKEIHEIKRVLGLELGKTYVNMEDVNKHLRYSKLIFMTDQDLDGSHIKGLCINLFHSEWNSLVHIPEFIGFLNTPILKATRGKDIVRFYNKGEYDHWRNAHPDTIHLWSIKYYKGLGTSTDVEFREYLKDRRIVYFAHEGEASDDMVDLVFNKKRTDDRKRWLETYDRDCYADTSSSVMSYTDFVNKELIHFSKYDCDRSIPNIMDGLKRSLRKILFSSFKRKLTTDIKVSQFSGYVSEHSGYHHGEASLNAAIVGMAQDFVGSNNINLLVPNGQFGSRLLGGKDSASERYIFTRLNPITRYIFPEQDDNVLTYLEDDGVSIEPLYYIPIIPMILVNGGKGIGTGFSTTIPCYNPLTIIQYLQHRLTYGTLPDMEAEFVPYYEGFTGTITRSTSPDKFVVSGTYIKTGDDRIRITELPIGTWTEDYKEMLDAMTQSTMDRSGVKVAPIIKDYEDLYTKTTVSFEITLHSGQLDTLTHQQILSMFKLTNTISTNNMHLFDAEDKLKKYTSVCEIIDEFYAKRLELYVDRKRYVMGKYADHLRILTNKERYITSILSGELDLRGKRSDALSALLEAHGYDKEANKYDYLIKMPMDSVTDENVERLHADCIKTSSELEAIANTPEVKMWLTDLAALQSEYVKYTAGRTMQQTISVKSSDKSKVKVTKLKTKK
jgi:DNA topoisomerase-2